jgi:hypothetical protein
VKTHKNAHFAAGIKSEPAPFTLAAFTMTARRENWRYIYPRPELLRSRVRLRRNLEQPIDPFNFRMDGIENIREALFSLSIGGEGSPCVLDKLEGLLEETLRAKQLCLG